MMSAVRGEEGFCQIQHSTYLAKHLRVACRLEQPPRPGLLQERGVRGEDGGRSEDAVTVLGEGFNGLREN